MECEVLDCCLPKLSVTPLLAGRPGRGARGGGGCAGWLWARDVSCVCLPCVCLFHNIEGYLKKCLFHNIEGWLQKEFYNKTPSYDKKNFRITTKVITSENFTTEKPARKPCQQSLLRECT